MPLSAARAPDLIRGLMVQKMEVPDQVRDGTAPDHFGKNRLLCLQMKFQTDPMAGDS